MEILSVNTERCYRTTDYILYAVLSSPWIIYIMIEVLYLFIPALISPTSPNPSSLMVTTSHFSLLLCSFFSHLVFRLHIWMKSYGIFLSLPGLFHYRMDPVGPPMLLQKAGFLFRGWIIYSIVYMCCIFSIHSSIDGYFGCIHVVYHK